MVVGCDKESDSPEAEAITQRVPHFSPVLGEVGFGPLNLALPLRLAAGQLLDLRLLGSARIVAGLERLFRLALLASGALHFLAFISA